MKRYAWVTAIWRRDVLLLVDAPAGLVLSLASTVMGVMVFGLLGRFVGQGTGYVTYVLSGITFLRVVDAVVQSPGAGLREERSRGSLEVLVDSPHRSWAIVAAAGIVPAVRSLLEGTFALVLASVIFNAQVHPGLRGLVALPLAIAAFLLLALAAGLFLAGASMQSRAATAASSFFGLAIALTAQVYYPRAALPGWLQAISKASPFTAALKSLRAAITHGSGLGPDLAFALGSAVVIAALGAYLMERAVRLSRSSGAFARG